MPTEKHESEREGEREREREREEYLTNCVSRNLCSDERGQRSMGHRETEHGFKFCDRNLTQENKTEFVTDVSVSNPFFLLSSIYKVNNIIIIFTSMNISLIHNGKSVSFRKFVSEIYV